MFADFDNWFYGLHWLARVGVGVVFFMVLLIVTIIVDWFREKWGDNDELD